MQHGNESTKKQQDAAANSQCNFGHGSSNAIVDNIGKQVADTSLLVIEACAGTATLSSVLKDVGFEVLPIDFGKQKNTSHFTRHQLGFEKTTFMGFLGENCSVTTLVSFSRGSAVWHGIEGQRNSYG